MNNFRILPPDSDGSADTVILWTVAGVAGDDQPSHYDIQDRLRSQFPSVTFDSEQGEFFAYTDDELEAMRLVGLLNALFAGEVAAR